MTYTWREASNYRTPVELPPTDFPTPILMSHESTDFGPRLVGTLFPCLCIRMEYLKRSRFYMANVYMSQRLLNELAEFFVWSEKNKYPVYNRKAFCKLSDAIQLAHLHLHPFYVSRAGDTFYVWNCVYKSKTTIVFKPNFY